MGTRFTWNITTKTIKAMGIHAKRKNCDTVRLGQVRLGQVRSTDMVSVTSIMAVQMILWSGYASAVRSRICVRKCTATMPDSRMKAIVTKVSIAVK